MIVVTKEQLHAYVIVVGRKLFPDEPWLATNFNSNDLGKCFPNKLTKEACLKRLRPMPYDYYSFHCAGTSFYMEYALLAEKLIEWVENLTS